MFPISGTMMSRVLSMVLAFLVSNELSLFDYCPIIAIKTFFLNISVLLALSLVVAIQILFANNLMYLFVFSSCYLDLSSPHLLLGNIASF
jgi:uncharacterized membrane protein